MLRYQLFMFAYTAYCFFMFAYTIMGSLPDSNNKQNKISLLFINHASSIFVTSDVFVILLIKLLPGTIATSLIHFKADYCNSLTCNLPATQTNRLQLVLHSAARAVTKTPKFHHITPILQSLHWLKLNERIK